jgi:hypothetical protein
MLQSPNINIVPQNQIGDAVAQGFQGLQQINQAKILDEQQKIQKFQELADITFTNTGMGNNQEVVEAANAYVSKLSEAARQYQGNIPYAVQSQFMKDKRDLMLLTKRSVEDEANYKKVFSMMASDQDKWDQEETLARLEEIKKRPLSDRPDYHSALVPTFEPISHFKKIVPDIQKKEVHRGTGDDKWAVSVETRDVTPIVENEYDANPRMQRHYEKRFKALRDSLDDGDNTSQLPKTPKELAVMELTSQFNVNREATVRSLAPRTSSSTKKSIPPLDLTLVDETKPPVTQALKGKTTSDGTFSDITIQTRSVPVPEDFAKLKISSLEVHGALAVNLRKNDDGQHSWSSLPSGNISGKPVDIVYMRVVESADMRPYLVIRGSEQSKEVGSSISVSGYTQQDFRNTTSDMDYYVPITEELIKALERRLGPDNVPPNMRELLRSPARDTTSYRQKGSDKIQSKKELIKELGSEDRLDKLVEFGYLEGIA